MVDKVVDRRGPGACPASAAANQLRPALDPPPPWLTIRIVLCKLPINHPNKLDKQTPRVARDGLAPLALKLEPERKLALAKLRLAVGARYLLARCGVGDEVGEGRGPGGECERDEDLPEGEGWVRGSVLDWTCPRRVAAPPRHAHPARARASSPRAPWTAQTRASRPF